MATDVYFYANGNDPFIFRLGGYTVHVLAGPPPSTASGPAIGSTPGIQVAPGPGLTLPPKSRIPPPIALSLIHSTDDMRDWLNQAGLELGDQPVRFRLDAVSGPSRPEINRLLESLQDFGDREVSVEIVGWSGPSDG